MYGKWVTLNLGEDFQCKVWVSCLPSTLESELQRMAINKLQCNLPKEKKGFSAAMDSLEIILDRARAEDFDSKQSKCLEQRLRLGEHK
ncbi:hypothetical protein PC41400_14690 [Paenibacillus chitinolyticus]|uniref:Uncharacterized protein n=1 Tax=Paenibacillus chitinolyticus TaxID=79263 RepID=A0A410WX53_9BACL|nr:hypothetical protein [Paenibacillus chitinolyticus]MCY9593981.1 hypothetical protein [Paenibacillus chitinolyticus]MCY9599636.1 hypothetical protein [Paenibacillus chitinolyticus]QAV18857.1 hypothetical protein PC41400_14690 [Paenibacillus chitinolyticus]